jgi:hypothetical protein
LDIPAASPDSGDGGAGAPPAPGYWVYRTRVLVWRGRPVRAKLRTPDLDEIKRGSGFISPQQPQPYGFSGLWTFSHNPNAPAPDNLPDDSGFTLFSARLAHLMDSFGVSAESWRATLTDSAGRPLMEREYVVFHSLEGVLAAMDEAKSGWTGDPAASVPRLVLDGSKFEHRPLFVCNHVYAALMRDDLKRAIQAQGITGFEFCRPERFSTGRYGLTLEFEET